MKVAFCSQAYLCLRDDFTGKHYERTCAQGCWKKKRSASLYEKTRSNLAARQRLPFVAQRIESPQVHDNTVWDSLIELFWLTTRASRS